MRSVAIYENPVLEPGVCACCGSQQKDWFIDLGLNYEGGKTNPNNEKEPVGSNYKYPDIWFDGAILYCCDCFNNLITTAERKFHEYQKTHIVKVELHGRRHNDNNFDGSDPIPDGNDQSLNPAVELQSFNVGQFSSPSV